MKERINWIDWAKALAVMAVVFCHLPQSQEWFYFRYLQACAITIFFFISGYLKKDRGSDKENWKKYWHGLILPYIIYNVLVYPYWLVKYYMLNGFMPDFYSAIKPMIGALLFEHESFFAEPLNGPLWYLPAILFMHVTIDLCRKTKHQHAIMISFCIISFFLYAANIKWQFMHNMTPMGIFRRLPYYYLGYIMGQKRLYRNAQPKRNLLWCIVLFFLSLIIFDWHLHEERLLPHVILFYPLNICFLFSMLYGCKALDFLTTKFIINLSIGTLLIIGLHFPVIGMINYLTGQTCYHWYEALPTTLLVTIGLYPLIPLAKRYSPIFIGRPYLWNKQRE